MWSRPSSFLAVSKASSIAQRRPSAATSASIGVPAGHQVAKNARSPSEVAPDQQAAGPEAHGAGDVLVRPKVGELELVA